MTQVFYFGQTSMCPIIDYKFNLSEVIKCVNFNPSELTQMETEEEREIYSDYLQMIQHIDPRKLKFKKVTCGYKSTLLIDENNELWGFGSSLNGQLGTYKMKYIVNRPFNISRLNDKMFLNACISQTHALAISTTEKLYSWGSTQYGCLGENMKEMHQYQLLKLRKNMFVSQSESFERKTVYDAIACGEHFSLIVCNDKLFSFGKEEKGRLGCGQQNIQYTQKPFQVLLPLNVKQVKGVSCGKNHCLMWDQDGLIYSWGDGADGKLGHSSVKGKYNYVIVDPQQIKALEEHRIIQASCGYRHSCALTFKGEIFTWGRTVYYKHEQRKELPLDYLRPKQISSFFCYDDKAISAGAFFVKISSCAYHNAAIDRKGFLYTWGQNKQNCLGHNNSNDYNYPILVEEFTSMKVVDVSCGHHFTVVISTKATNELAYKNLKEFKLNLIKNAKQNISKIQEYFEKKLRKNSSLGRNKSQSQISTIKQNDHQNKEDEQHHQNQYQKQTLIQKQTHPQVFAAPRSLSQPTLFNQKDSQNQKQTPSINNQVKEKYTQLAISDSLYKQNINTKIMLLDQQQKQILNQRPLTSNNRSYNSNQDLLQRIKSQSNYTATHKNLLQKQESTSRHRNLKKKTSFFEYKDNQIIFDTIQGQLDQEYEEFCQQDNLEQKSPKNQAIKQIQDDYANIQRKQSDVSTKRERLSEIQMRAEHRRTISNQQKQGIILSDTIFNQEIEQIYKEYKDADILHNPKNAVKKYVRQKSNDFQRSRQQLSSETRKKFQQARSEFTSNQNSEPFKTPLNSSQTLSIIQNQFPLSNFTSLSNLGSPQKQLYKSEDFLAQDKWKLNENYLIEKYENQQKKIILHDERIQTVLERKSQLEQQKKEDREQQRQQLLLKSKEYQIYLEKMSVINKNQNSIRMNWLIYLNLEMLCHSFKQLSQIGLERAKENFFFVTRLKKIQKHFRKKLVLRKMFTLTTKQRMILRIMCLKLVYKLRIKNTQRRVHLIVLNFLKRKSIQKIQLKLISLRNNIFRIQTFMRWCYNCQNFQLYQLTKIWDTHLINLCQNGNTTRLQDPKHQEIYKEKLERLSSQYCVKRSQSGDFTVASSKYEDYQTFLEKKMSFRGSMVFTLQSIPDFYGQEQSNNQNIEQLINEQANKEQTKLGLILSNLNVGAKAHGQQLKEVLSRNILQVEQQEVQLKIGTSPLKISKNQSKIQSLEDLNDQMISQMGQKDNTNNISQENQSPQKKKLQIIENKSHHRSQHTNYKFDFSKSLLPYSIHANDIVTPNIYSIRLEIIKANEQAMKVASEAEQVIKKKILLSVLRSIRSRHQHNIQQYEKILQKFMQDNQNQINMERARLMLITPANILNQIWNKEQDNVKFRGVKRSEKNHKKDHLPFFDLKIKIASQIQNAPIKPSFKLQMTQDYFKQFFNKYYDQVRKQYALLEQKGLIRAQVKKKN
ncbi:chromosome condensation regulator RCC1 repeat protein (macronuclear) [Tetrahymena thermophila SB210]|uniref:Chromosome condensation regulator RCC1 repeat protein n=1 Tax=Tetrahymena thermophila (strain SB210) TaxID=312017 RepID=I7LXX9_TETTS|nr:chromosome condensation regulator RCC1 repeat protein [Tetrahymena thermophila SB210]EAS06741.2 chromosome condensation regulator RCC1 repeat protein [Tetrahymena thermophila SB210]|eukprot:XP_001026983.2 chromosome condensation regulator RCC1 repeat protein [Tetrahymena thermophila SB210]